jgi:uncharacterized coiled-coil protein SlyX
MTTEELNLMIIELQNKLEKLENRLEDYAQATDERIDKIMGRHERQMDRLADQIASVRNT